MNVVGIYRPNLCAHRFREVSPPLSVAQLYHQVENFVVELHRNPAEREELHEDSLRIKGKLTHLVETTSELNSDEETSLVTLAALTGGMFAGSLDGVLLFHFQEVVEQPSFQSSHEHLAHPAKILKDNLEKVLTVAHSSWKQAHVDDLQLLSGYAKHQNRHSLEEGLDMEKRTRKNRAAFQKFLLATFKGAYAMGVADAAVMFVGGEAPGAPPTSSESAAGAEGS